MTMIHLDIDKEAEECAQRVVSNAYDESDWCEDGSIRQDIKDLKSQMIDVDDELMELSHKIDGLLKLLKTIGD